MQTHIYMLFKFQHIFILNYSDYHKRKSLLMSFMVDRGGLISISTASSQQEATVLISNIMALFGDQ